MIPCQRELFDIPEDVAWLSCAQHSPALRTVGQAGREGVQRKCHPWTIGPQQHYDDVEDLRRLFAELIGATADDIALTPSVSYGLSIAARNLDLGAGRRILVLQDQFPSNVYPWRDLVERQGGEIVTVARPADGDWTAAVLAQLDERIAILALPHCHWTDGGLLDLERIAATARRLGAALVLDLTQSLGVLPCDVQRLRPDFIVAGAYKWLLGPYRFAYLYAAEKHHQGHPLEQGWGARLGSNDRGGLTRYSNELHGNARRFDVGEHADYIAVPMAAAALRQILAWGVSAIAESLSPLVDEIGERGEAMGLAATPKGYRSPHFLGLYFPPDRFSEGASEALVEGLRSRNVFVSQRGASLRVAPYLFNNRRDLDRFFETLQPLLR